MANEKKPLIIDAGQVRELATGETLDAVVTAKEVVNIESASGVTLNQGDIVYINSSGLLALADASATASKYPIGFVRGSDTGTLTNISAGSNIEVQTDGSFTVSDWTNIAGAAQLTRGAKYYLSTTAGDISASAPTTANHFVVPIGRAIGYTTMYIEIGEPIRLS